MTGRRESTCWTCRRPVFKANDNQWYHTGTRERLCWPDQREGLYNGAHPSFIEVSEADQPKLKAWLEGQPAGTGIPVAGEEETP